MPASPLPAGRRRRSRALLTATTALALLVGPTLGAVPASADEPVPDPTPSVSAPTTPVVAPVVAPDPAELGVDGTAAVGGSLEVAEDATVWQPSAGLVFTYQWVADDVPIDGATAATFTPGADLAEAELAVDVTGTLPGDPPSSATVRVPVGTVAPATLTAPTPRITGRTEVGSTVTAVPGTWAGGTALTTTWLVGGVAVSTARTLTLKAEHAGRSLVLQVDGRLAGHTAASARTSPVTVAAAPAWPTPRIAGTVRVGAKVTAQAGTWPTGTRLAYRWYADGRAAPGADSRTLTIPAAQRGDRLTVRVTGTRSGAAAVTRTSAARTVAAGVLKTARPTLSGLVGGKAKVGKKLTAKPRTGAWTPDPTSVRYRWKADGRAISGATRSTYTPKAGQTGKKITVTVTGYRSGYTAKAASSSAVVVAKPFSRTTKPRITGNVRLGSTLRVVRGTWKPNPASLSYRWKANGKPIAGATGKTYRLRAADLNKRITVTVTGHRKASITTARTSAKTARVQLPKPALTRAGTFKVGRDIKPGTYVAYAYGDTWCTWSRRADAKNNRRGEIANDYGYGHRIVTIKASDEYFRTSGCGAWYKFYPVGGLKSRTPTDSVLQVGSQLRPGLYETSGPAYADNQCNWSRLRSFTGYTAPKGSKNVIARGAARAGDTVRIRSSDAGFETFGCRWTRISN
ncbi:hypothetical protein [Isoptericola dokdonensis]|uniref:Uncharacterized protein n=1 Tax=Isoptericola dokdonensis DS-3 TaxID=1300344 RepID=A0A168FKG3_9MICO|nr:hypothetical protein [Isoptericola dokdonensis]ANC32016.1 hypothetical protein I598_2479 [Isoptericola dokdonensis DS-3]